MPEYDLGTAHGKIKIDVDDRGAKTGEKTLEQFQRTVSKLQRQFQQYQASVNKMEAELKKVARDFAAGNREARNYSGGVDKADGSQRKFNKSGSTFSDTLNTVGDRLKSAARHAENFAGSIDLSNANVDTGRRNVGALNIRLEDLIRRLYLASQAAERFGPAIANAFTVFGRLGNSAGGINGFIKSFAGLPFAGRSLGILTNSFLGLNKAMKDIPRWQKSIVNLVGAFSGLAITSKVASAVFNGIFRKADFHPVEKYGERLKEIAFHLTRAIGPAGKVAAQIEHLNNSFKNFGIGAAKAIAGLAIMKGGVNGLAQRFAFLAKLPAPVLAAIAALGPALGAALQVGAKGLTIVSNVLLGLLDGVKQLAGGFLAIPGAILTAATAVGVLKLGFLSLKKTFEGVFKAKDTEELKAALDALPEALRPLGQVLSDVKQQFEGVTNVIRDTLISNVEKPIKDLTGQYFPLLGKQGKVVANSLRGVAEAGVDFALQPDTVRDIGLAFTYTSQTVNNLKAALGPLLTGMRDVAVVGAAFIRDFTVGGQGVTERFAEWAKLNRENGNLMTWMQEAVSGAKDLLRGIWDLTKGLWSLLTLFADEDGSDALQRFADAMEKFNKWVNESKASGVLREIGDAVRGLGTDKIEEFKDLLRSVGDAAKEVWPVVKQIGSAFQDVFVPAIKASLQIIESFAKAISDLGLETYIGWVLGLVAAFGLLKTVTGPIRDLIRVFAGLGTALSGAKTLLSGFVDVLYYFGPAGAKVSTALSKIGAAMTAMAGPIAAVVAGFILAWTQVRESQSVIDDFNSKLDEGKKHVLEFKNELREAFKADAGVSGKNVFDVVKDQVDTSIADIKAQAESVPGIWDNIRETVFGNPLIGGRGNDGGLAAVDGTIQGDDFNAMQKAAQDAEHAKVAFDKLGLSSDQLASKATGTDAEFNGLKATLQKLPEGSAEAIAVLQRIRDEYTQTQAEFAKAGPGSVALVNGIAKIAEAGGDATTKLQGLKEALAGLGLDKTTEYENAIAFAESIRKIGEEAATAADKSAPMNDIFGPDGTFNAGSVNAANLFNLLSPAVEKFKQAAAGGQDIGKAFDDLVSQVPALAQGFGQSEENIRALITALGGIPDIVSILVNVKDGDKTAQELAAIVAKLETTAAGTEITIPIVADADPEKIKQAVKSALGIDATVTEDTVTIPAGVAVDQAALDALKASLSKNGIALPGAPAAPPAPIAVTPAPVPAAELPAPEPKKGDKKTPEPVAVAPTPADTAALDAANQEIAELKKKVDELNQTPAKIQIDTANLSEVRNQIKSLQDLLVDNKLEFTIIAKGYDETNYVIGTVKKAITDFLAEVAKIQPALVAAFNTQPLDNFSAAMQVLVNTMFNNGASMVAQLAAGMLSSKSLVDEAGSTIADAVQDYLKPGSPTKKGPLSGKGWTLYSGQKIVDAFAQGMTQQSGAVAKAGSGVAGSAAGALQGPYDVGKFLGQLQQLSDFGQHLAEVFFKLADTVVKAISFISDPLGKGTFFGQSKGSAFGFRRDPNISDDDLRRKREDDLQAKLSSPAATKGGLKDLPGISGLGDNATKEEIAAAILGEATKRGYDPEVGKAAIAAALKESGLDPTVTNSSGHESLFQTSSDKGVGHEPAAQLKWFFDTMDSLGGPPAVAKDPYGFIADNIEKGGYSGSQLKREQGDAAARYVDAMTSALAAGAPGVADRSDVKITGEKGLTDVTENLLNQVIAAFPEVKDIGGVRADAIKDHPSGRALDIMTGGDFDLGDRINDWLRGNAEALGIDSTIWRNTWKDFEGNASTVAGHMDHIHAKTIAAAQGFDNTLLDPNATDPAKLARDQGGLGPDLSDLTPGELKTLNETTGLSLQTQDQMLAELRKNNTSLDTALTAGQAEDATTDQQIQALTELQKVIDTSATDDTPAGRQKTQALQGVKSDIMDKGGLAEGANPVDQAGQLLSGVSSIAGSVFQVINSSLESFGAAKQIGDTLVRGVENSEDIYNMIDSIQKFIELAANIAGAVSSITSAVGSIMSIGAGADFGASGAVSAVGQIAGLVQSALETVNAVIDLGQEVYRIAGSYVGELLGFLAGGASKLEGNVKFLLDYNDKTLKAWSQDNPMDKREHAFGRDPSRNDAPQIGEVNVYGGPGQDPRDTTRNMMFAVKSAGMGAGGLN